MNLFTEAATHYGARPGVTPEVVEAIASHIRTPIHHLVDLGAGDGKVAEQFAARLPDITTVTAVELDETMCNVARDRLEELAAHGYNVHVVNAGAEEAELPTDNSVELAIVCRAFHCMDRERVLRRLDPVVASLGGVAVLKDLTLWDGVAPWQQAIRKTIQEYLGEERRAGKGVFQTPEPYRDTFAASPFPDVVEISLDVVRRWEFDPDMLLSWVHSNSYAAPGLFGDALSSFQSDVIENVEPFVNGDGVLAEPNRFDILVGRRPQA